MDFAATARAALDAIRRRLGLAPTGRASDHPTPPVSAPPGRAERTLTDPPAAAPPSVPPRSRAPQPDTPTPAPQASPTAPADDGPGEWIAGVSQSRFGACSYRLYVPPQAAAGAPLPLLVMLHGCTQTAEQFAEDTGMNALARRAGVFVLYPQQARSANPGRCWNWFLRINQQPGTGELALLAETARDVAGRHRIDARRVWVAGLSAGAAMAALLARCYSEQFTAAGLFAGMAPGSSGSAAGALAAMRRGAAGWPPPSSGRAVPVIVFQGDADTVVNPANADQVLASFVPVDAHAEQREFTANQRRVTLTTFRDAEGRLLAESWRVHGCGHAWCGAPAEDRYADPLGPNASADMLRFFERVAGQDGEA